MSLPSVPANFANVRAVAQTRIEYPFIELGDSTTKIYRMICQQSRDSYNPAGVALDTTMANATNAGVISLPFSADATAYFVGDFNHTPIDGGMIEFERVFANIPQNRDDEFAGTQVFSYPGIKTTDEDIEGGTERSVTAVTGNAGAGTSVLTLSGLSGSVQVGDLVYISVSWGITGGGTIAFNGFRGIISIDTGLVKVTVPYITQGDTFNTGGTMTELIKQPRGVDPQVTGSVVDVSYYLPGVSAGITDPTDVAPDNTFKILDTVLMKKTDTLSTVTIPTSDDYQSDIDANNFLTISSEVSRWMGNIIKKVNRKVRAL